MQRSVRSLGGARSDGLDEAARAACGALPACFERALPLRLRGPFHLYAATHASTCAPRLVVVPAPEVPRAAAARALARLAGAHRIVEGAAFPRVASFSTHAAGAFVAFAIAPACDGEEAVARLRRTSAQLPYPQAMGVVEHLGRALERAHQLRDAAGAALALGGMGWANVVIASDGMPYLLGLGHNVIGRDEHGALAGTPSFFAPPELAQGGAPTPSSDAFAFVMLQRSVLSCCALPPALARIFAGAPHPEDGALEAIIAWSTQRVLAAAPSARGSITELRTRWLEECRLLGIAPDLDGARETLRPLVAGSPASRAEVAHLVLGPEASWFRAPDGLVWRLDGRGAYKRVLLRLVDAQLRGDGARVDADALFEAGWPGQCIGRGAALNRLYVTLASLRKMGLRGALQRDDRGYRLDPALPVRFALDGETPDGARPPTA